MATAWHAVDVTTIESHPPQPAGDGAGNTLPRDAAPSWPAIFLRQFKSILILILGVAALLAFMVGERLDAVAILAIVILNAGLGFAQEWKAETTLHNLRRMLAPRCRVLRNGVAVEIDAALLVPGDRVLLAAGSAVPADLRLIRITNLKADESALTGESGALSKTINALPADTPLAERTNMAWMGTHIVNGHGEGIVTAIGTGTEFGRIACLARTINEGQTHLQKHLDILARQLGAFALFISAAVIIIGIVSGHDIAHMMMTGISLAVAAIPEGLPAVVTITLALGIGAMARRRALLRHLQAAETLGAVSVICTDKTGTLTRNEMTLQKIWLADGEIDISGAGYIPEGVFTGNNNIITPAARPALITFLETGRACNSAAVIQKNAQWHITGSATEAALLVAAMKAGMDQHNPANVSTEFSFNSDRKRMSIVTAHDGALIAHVKGAPESLLSLCTHILIGTKTVPITDENRAAINAACADFANGGLRTLALARRMLSAETPLTEQTAESGLTFVGIAGLIDPPRPEAAQALALARSAGIRVIVITGDSADTARAVTGQIGLSITSTITGTELATMDDDTLKQRLAAGDCLFARAVPEDKYRIVMALQAQGHLVAMTGDGVNDAPALKQADIGIAMGIRGTDVAKSASDIILTDDNFSTIVAAIEEGRRQYDNIRKFVQFLVAHSIGEVAAVFLNILSGAPLILLPVQILWINLATDSITALALSVEKAEDNIMRGAPRDPNAPIITRRAMISLGAAGLYIGFVTLALFHHYLPQSTKMASTIAFTTIVITAQALVIGFRSFTRPLSVAGWFSNPWLLAAIAFIICLHAAALYHPLLQAALHTVPLSLQDWALIAAVALPLLAVPEIVKIIRYRKERRL